MPWSWLPLQLSISVTGIIFHIAPQSDTWVSPSFLSLPFTYVPPTTCPGDQTFSMSYKSIIYHNKRGNNGIRARNKVWRSSMYVSNNVPNMVSWVQIHNIIECCLYKDHTCLGEPALINTLGFWNNTRKTETWRSIKNWSTFLLPLRFVKMFVNRKLYKGFWTLNPIKG